jgi:PAS domain S-box-containing protein
MNNPTRILFIEDIPEDFELAESELRRGGIHFTALRVDSEKDLKKALQKFHPDIVISDYSMPGFDGMQALKISLNHDPDTPVIMLTGSTRKPTAVECMKAGATDYVFKEHLKRLPFAVSGALENREIKAANEKAAKIINDNNEALRKSEEQLRDIIFTMGDWVWEVDENGIYTYSSKKGSDIFGYKSEDILGKTPFDFMPPDEAKRVGAIFTEITANKAPIKDLENWNIKKNGEKICLLTNGVPILDNLGNLKGYRGVDKDITSRKQTEQNQERLVAMLDATPGFVGFADSRDTRIQYINTSGRKMVGIRAKEDVTRFRIWDVHPEWTNKMFREEIIPTAIRDGIWTGECAFLNRDGREIPVLMALLAHKSQSGEVERFSTVSIDITKDRKAKEALRKSEEKLKEAQAKGRIGSWEFDIESQKITWSDQTYKLYDRNPALGPPNTEQEAAYYSPEQVKILHKYFRCAIEEGKDFNYDMEVKLPGGRKVYFSATMHPVKGEHGQVTRLFGTVQDITERKQSEEALILEKENFRHSIDNSPLGIRIISTKGDTLYTNKAFLDIYGYDSLEELQDTPLKDRYTPETYIESQKRKKMRIQGDLSPTDYEIGIIRKNGETRYLRVFRKEVIWNGKKQYQAIYDDITESKLAKVTLQLSEAKYRDLIELAWDAIFIVNRIGAILMVNTKACELLGCGREEALKMNLVNTYLIEERMLFSKRIATAEKGEARRYERSFVRKDGTVLPVEVTIGLLPDGSIQGIIRDITGRKLAEEKIKNMNESLEKLNLHLDTIRENERAIISREIHDQLGQALTALKIDLNWLCRKITANSVTDAKLRSMIELVTATISDVQRISSELRPAMLDDIGLAATLEWYCEEFANRTGLKIDMHLDDVQMDDMRKNLNIYRILQESFTNIIRHAGAKKVQVKLGKIKNDLILTIQDDGIGISPEKINSSASLGLLGMSERAKQCGGRFEIICPVKGGTEISVYVPIK